VKALKCGHHLRDLLIVPVQRIPRYVILLEEIARYTDTTHPDYKDLSLALSKMHCIADYVNEKKRDFESLAQVSAIQDTLVGISILEYPRLRFLLEGTYFLLFFPLLSLFCYLIVNYLACAHGEEKEICS